MSSQDFRGDPITGATASAVAAFERALADFRSWRGDPTRGAAAVLEEAPDFVMAYVLWAYVLLCTRDPARVRAAAPLYAKAAGLPANRRERLHLAVIAATLRDDYERAQSILGELLEAHPRDVLALQVAHAYAYLAGDVARLVDRVSAVAGAWSPDLPGYHAVLAMRAFGLVESGEYDRAEAIGLQALALEPLDARAHHTMAHVFEMSGRPEDGLRWMSDRVAAWDGDTFVATHCRWHQALFHLERGEIDRALALHDNHIRRRDPKSLADLIDASSLLWRISLIDADVGDRWAGLAADWSSHIGDRFCSFSDLHAMMAFVGAREWDLAASLVRELGRQHLLPTRHGSTSRQLGLPASRALLAFGLGDFADVIRLLGRLPPVAHRLGGSQAQRDIIELTLRAAQARSGSRARVHRLAA